MLFSNINVLLALALSATSALAAGPSPRDIYRDHARLIERQKPKTWKKSLNLPELGFLQKKETAGSDSKAAALERRKTCKAKNTTNTTDTTNTKTTQPAPPKNETAPANTGTQPKTTTNTGSCFPSLGFTPPSGTPSTSLDDWWCDSKDEAGFLGFSYGVFGCQSKSKLQADFKKMRSTYNTRYVRVYGECPNERADFLDDIIETAYENGMGVLSTVWLGWDASDKSWKTRLSHIENTIKTNPLAPYVIRTVDVGSEPLLDQPISPNELLSLLKSVKAITSPKGIKAGISEMRYSYGKIDSSLAKEIFSTADYVHAHELSFLGGSATTGTAAWKSVSSDLTWFASQAPNKKVLLTQTGWPTNQQEWKSASKKVDDSVGGARDYMEMLNDKCADMKEITGSGVGWFWQTWSETDLRGWGLIKSNGQPQFEFKGVTSC